MQSFIETIVILIQLALAGFVMWGGWLCLQDRFGRDHPAGARDAQAAPPAKVDSFERVVSLVLLALLFTTLAAVA